MTRAGTVDAPGPTGELRSLTSLRGLAAWLVVAYHIRGSVAGLPEPVAAVVGRGYLAVDFFFLLSGFVIWLTWHARLRDPAAIPRFLQKRIARIWPLHAAMLLAALTLALALRATGRDDPAFPLSEWPLHLLLVQNWGFTDALAWNDPAWSISCEFAAYLLCPLLVMAIDWRRWPAVALVAAAAALLVLLHVAMEGAPSLGHDIPRFGLRRCLAEFATGTILAALFLRRPPALPLFGLAALFAGGWALGAPETLAAPATFAALLLGVACTAGRPRHPLEGRLLHHVGEISYATYLSHFLLWKAFKLVAVSDRAPLPPASIALYALLVLAASLVLYHGLERPAQGLLNRARPDPRRRMPT